jgi:hypothetical protein
VANGEVVLAVQLHPALVLSVVVTDPPAAPTVASRRLKPKLHCEPQPMSASMALAMAPGVWMTSALASDGVISEFISPGGNMAESRCE